MVSDNCTNGQDTPFIQTLSQACFRFRSHNAAHTNIEINAHAYRTVWHSTLIHIWCYATEMCERWLVNVQEAAHSLFCFVRYQESCYSKRTTKGRVEVFEVSTSFKEIWSDWFDPKASWLWTSIKGYSRNQGDSWKANENWRQNYCVPTSPSPDG